MSTIHVLVDHANTFSRAWFSAMHLINARPWIPLVRYFDMVRTCIGKSRFRIGDYPVVVYLAGESRTVLRKARVVEGYKAHRKPEMDPRYRLYRKNLSYILQSVGLKVCRSPGYEADDVLASLAKTLPTSVILSNDHDLFQALEFPGVEVYTARGFMTRQIFERGYGFEVERFRYYKALVGDKSDGYPGVYGWGPVKAKKHIISNDWLEQLDDKEMDIYKTQLALAELETELEFDEACRFEGFSGAETLDLSGLRKINKQGVFEVELAVKKLLTSMEG